MLVSNSRPTGRVLRIQLPFTAETRRTHRPHSAAWGRPPGLSASQNDRPVEQFWLRRNLTPGTVGNEFKDEHYRRIAYANARFATTSGTAGWRTDRGRIFIIYSPPGKIEDHPGGSRRFPSSRWLYRHIDGISDKITVEFVDRTGTGNYQMAPGPTQR